MAVYYKDKDGKITTIKNNAYRNGVVVGSGESGKVTKNINVDDDIAPVPTGKKHTNLATIVDLPLTAIKSIGYGAEWLADKAAYGVANVADEFGADEFAEKVRTKANEKTVDKWTKGAQEYVDKNSLITDEMLAKVAKQQTEKDAEKEALLKRRAELEKEKTTFWDFAASFLPFATEEMERKHKNYVGGVNDYLDREIREIDKELAELEGKPYVNNNPTFTNLTQDAFMRSVYNSKYGLESFKQAAGIKNNKEYYADKLNEDEYSFVADDWYEKLLSGSAEQLGQWFVEYTDPKTLGGAAALAGTAALAGQAGPQVALPEEVFTVPGAALIGLKTGAATTAFEIEMGHAYNEMIENGISHETASILATGAGIGIAALETMQLDDLVKSYKILSKTDATKSAAKTVLKYLTKRGINIASETAQEVAQEGVTIGATQVGSKIDKGEWAYNGKEIKDRLIDTAEQSAWTFAGLGIGGDIINYGSKIVNNKSVNINSQASDDKILTKEPRTLEKGETLKDSSVVLEKDEDKYSYDVRNVIDGYENAVNAELLAKINEVKNGNYKDNDVVYFSNVSDRASSQIKNILGIDVSGFRSAIEARQIKHILNRHGEKGIADTSMRNDSDIARIEFVLDNFDTVEYGGKSAGYTTNNTNGKSRQADTVLYSKKINGTYYVVQAVPDTKRKTLYVVSAYIGDKKTEAGKTVDVFPGETSKETSQSERFNNDSYQTSAINSIYNNSGNINNENVNNQDGEISFGVSLGNDDASRSLLRKYVKTILDAHKFKKVSSIENVVKDKLNQGTSIYELVTLIMYNDVLRYTFLEQTGLDLKVTQKQIYDYVRTLKNQIIAEKANELGIKSDIDLENFVKQEFAKEKAYDTAYMAGLRGEGKDSVIKSLSYSISKSGVTKDDLSRVYDQGKKDSHTIENFLLEQKTLSERVMKENAVETIAEAGVDSSGKLEYNLGKNYSNEQESDTSNNMTEDDKVKEENNNVRKETISDTENAQSTRGMGEKVSGGERSNRERISGRIKEILRKSSVERNAKSIAGRRTARIEQKETAEAFEERALKEGYEYRTNGTSSVSYKESPKDMWNSNAKECAQTLERLGLNVIVFEGTMWSNGGGVTEASSDGLTFGIGDMRTVFISSKLDIDGMETGYHEAFHTLRKGNGYKYHYKMIDIISSGIDVESEAFENFVSYIGGLYSYEVKNVSIDKFSQEITEEFYAWYIGKIYAKKNAHGVDMRSWIEQFSDADNIKEQLDAVFAEINNENVNNQGALDVVSGLGVSGKTVYSDIIIPIIEDISGNTDADATEVSSVMNGTFKKYYDMGKGARSFRFSSKTQSISRQQAMEIYNAGLKDADVKKKAVFHKNATLIENDALKLAKISKLNIQKLKALASVIGKNIEFVESIALDSNGVETINAQYDSSQGKIILSAKATEFVEVSAIHEVIHAIRESSPESYEAIANEIIYLIRKNPTVMKKYVDLIEDSYQEEYANDPDRKEKITEEVVADAVAHALKNSTVLKGYTQKSAKVFAPILEGIKKLRDKITTRRTRPHYTDEQRQAYRLLEANLERIEKAFSKAINTHSQIAKMSLQTSVENDTNSTQKEVIYSSKNIAKKSKLSYNEYNTTGMQWAYNSSTKIGDVKVLYNPYKNKYVLVEATKDDVGFIELEAGSLEQMREDLKNYARNEHGNFDDDERIIDTAIHNFEAGQNNNTRNNVNAENGTDGIRNAEISKRQSISDGTADSSKIENYGREGQADLKYYGAHEIKNSRNIEWRSDLTKSQMTRVLDWIGREQNPETKRITDTACWYKGRIDGEDLFVIYSTEDAEPTILYEKKGDRAKEELAIILDLLEEIENGDGERTRSIGKSETIDKVSGSGWMQQEDNIQNNTISQRGRSNKNAGVLQGQSKRNTGGALWNVIDNLFGRTGNLIPERPKDNIKNSRSIKKTENYPEYSTNDYEDFGWARANNILNAGQNKDYRSKFAAAKSGTATFNKSKKGEYIIPVSDIYDSVFRDVNNVLVFAKGTIDNPIITSVIEIYEYDETILDRIRRQIYDCERRGIQREIEGVFRRYNSSSYEFKQSGTISEWTGNSSNDGYRGRSGLSDFETERTDEITKDNSIKNSNAFTNVIYEGPDGDIIGEDISGKISNYLTKERAKIDRWGKGTTFKINPGNKEKYTTRTALLSDIEKLFNVPISRGKDGAMVIDKKDAEYRKYEQSITIRYDNDLPAVAEALGYHIDQKLNISGSIIEQSAKAKNSAGNSENVWGVYEDELSGLFGPTYSGSNEDMSRAFSEFMRIFLMNTEKASQLAPNLYTFFMGRLHTDNQFESQVLAAANKINAYFALDSKSSYASHVLTQRQRDEQRKRETTISNTIKTGIKDTKKVLVDKNIGIKFTLDKHGASEKAYIEATNVANASAAANYILNEHFVDFEGREVQGAECLADIFSDIIGHKTKVEKLTSEQKLEQFGQYLVLRHAFYLIKDKKTVFGDTRLDDELNIQKQISDIEKQHPEYKDFAKRIYAYQTNLMLYYNVESGAISKENAQKLFEKYPCYVPFNRINEKSLVKESRTSKGLANLNRPIEHIVGSSQTIRNPIESLISATNQIVDFAYKNKVCNTLVDTFAGIDSIHGVMEKVYSGAEYQRLIESGNDTGIMTLSDVFNVGEIDDGGKPKQYNPVASKKEQIISVWRDGKKQFYRILDPVLYDGLVNLEIKELSDGWKYLATCLKVIKMGITTFNPFFGIRNVIRDFYTFHYNSKYSHWLGDQIFMYFGSLWNIMRKSDDYKRYIALGGGNNTRHKALISDAIKIAKDKSFSKNKLLYFPSKVLNAYIIANEVFEQIPRFAEFKATLKDTGDAQLASYNAADVTTNFKRFGTAGRQLNTLFLFNNAAIQGLDKLYRSFSESSPKERTKKVLKYVGMGFTMQIAMMAVARAVIKHIDDDDEEKYINAYNRLSEYHKANSDLWYIGNGQFLKTPKERELAVLRSTITFMYDKIIGNERDTNDFLAYIGEQFLLPMMPSDLSHGVKGIIGSWANNTMFSPFTDVAFNRNYMGNDIVPSYLTGPDFAKAKDDTTITAKALAKAIYDVTGITSISPIAIDHFISNTFGYPGQLINQVLSQENVDEKGSVEQAFKSFLNPIDTLGKGLEKNFLLDSTYSNTRVGDIYEEYDKALADFESEQSGEAKVRLEKYGVLKSIISVFNSYEQDKDTKLLLLATLEDYNVQSCELDEWMSDIYDDTGIKEIFISSYPKPVFSDTVKKVKYTASLTPQQYLEFIAEYDDTLLAVRQYVKTLGLTFEQSAYILAKCKSDITSSIKKKYLGLYGVSSIDGSVYKYNRLSPENIAEKQINKAKAMDSYEFTKAYEDAFNAELDRLISFEK